MKSLYNSTYRGLPACLLYLGTANDFASLKQKRQMENKTEEKSDKACLAGKQVWTIDFEFCCATLIMYV
jgi:hypothetical protein